MANKKKFQKSKKAKEKQPNALDKRLKASRENLLRDKEKRYQRTILGPQVENQTTLKEKKKKPLPKPVVKKKK